VKSHNRFVKRMWMIAIDRPRGRWENPDGSAGPGAHAENQL